MRSGDTLLNNKEEYSRYTIHTLYAGKREQRGLESTTVKKQALETIGNSHMRERHWTKTEMVTHKRAGRAGGRALSATPQRIPPGVP